MTKPVFTCLLGAVQTLVSVLFLRMIDQVSEVIKYQMLKSLMSLAWGITIVIVFVLADCRQRFQFQKGCGSCGAGKAGVGFLFLRGFELGLLLVVGSRCSVVAANGSGCHSRCELAEFEVLRLR